MGQGLKNLISETDMSDTYNQRLQTSDVVWIAPS